MNHPAQLHFQPTASTSVFPETIPLTDLQIQTLRSTHQWVSLAWTVASAALLFVGIRYLYNRYGQGTFTAKGAEEQSLWVLSVIGTLLGYLFYFFLGRYYIRRSRQDIRNGIKHVGMIELINKAYMYRHETSDIHRVTFKWLADPKGELIEMDDYDMYRKLKKGDTAYLERLPHSGDILVCKKIPTSPEEQSPFRSNFFDEFYSG